MDFGRAAALAIAIFGGTIFGTWAGPYLTGRAQAMGKAAIPQSSPASSQSAARDEIPSEIVTPERQKRLKPLLKRQSDFKTAASGFRDIEEFAAALHASKNIRVPFLTIKQQMVEEGRTLADAIRIVKPGANALLEADLARSEARSDLATGK